MTIVRHVKDHLLALWEPLARRASRAYVAGPDLASAREMGRELARARIARVVGFWNEEEMRPEAVFDEQLRALQALAEDGGDRYLALKAPALGFSDERTNAMARRAAEVGLRIHFDAQRADSVAKTWPLIQAAREISPLVGCTLPGRFASSTKDAELAARLGLSVRVVKGQTADPAAPRIDPRRGFLDVIDVLAGRARLVGVASHDVPLAREALHRLRRVGTPCELELLLGLPLAPSLVMARALGVSVRLYIPYGSRRLPYHLSEARENPKVLGWLMRDLGRSPAEELRHFAAAA